MNYKHCKFRGVNQFRKCYILSPKMLTLTLLELIQVLETYSVINGIYTYDRVR
jgi:hypothetical protein